MSHHHLRPLIGVLAAIGVAVASLAAAPAGAAPATPGTVPAAPSVPNGNLEAVVAAVPVFAAPATATVEGWAADPDTADQAVEIDVYATDGSFVGWGYASQGRGDVGNHGFMFNVVLPAGPVQACAYAIDTTDPTTHRFLGCVAGGPVGLPFGNLDAVVRIPGGLSVQGWAIDPDTTAAIEVDVYVDGTFAGFHDAQTPRDDLAPFGKGTAHGFAIGVAATEGTHQVCAYGINRVGPLDLNPQLGCITLAVTNQPLGNLDGDSVTGDGVVLIVQGWAFDPDITGAIEIDVLRDGQVAGYGWASEDRPDVAAAFPLWANVGRGFSIRVLANAGLSDPYCAYAINVGPGVNRLLGCTTGAR